MRQVILDVAVYLPLQRFLVRVDQARLAAFVGLDDFAQPDSAGLLIGVQRIPFPLAAHFVLAVPDRRAFLDLPGARRVFAHPVTLLIDVPRDPNLH
jgi:hypothetical protein